MKRLHSTNWTSRVNSGSQSFKIVKDAGNQEWETCV